jgi:thymidylate kinase
LKIAAAEPERFRVVDAAASVEETHTLVLNLVMPFLENRGQRSEVRDQ